MNVSPIICCFDGNILWFFCLSSECYDSAFMLAMTVTFQIFICSLYMIIFPRYLALRNIWNWNSFRQ
jgi:hypothetical protein